MTSHRLRVVDSSEVLTASAEQLLDAAPDAMVVIDEQGVIQLVNRQAELWFGYQRQELVGQLVEVLVPDSLKAVHPRHRVGYFAHPVLRPLGAGLELMARRRDGTEFPVDISLSFLETESGVLVFAAVRDITDRKAAEQEQRRLEQVAHFAMHDPLTGLPNRIALSARLVLATARREMRGALLFLDLDDFKRVNDELGHLTGDHVLGAVAERLARVVRPEDACGRWSGDEFMVLSETVGSLSEARALADRLEAAIAAPLEIAGRVLSIRASIGVAMLGGARDPELVIRLADAQMYLVKQEHRRTRRGPQPLSGPQP